MNGGMRKALTLLLGTLVLCGAAAAQGKAAASRWPLAVRLASYGNFQDAAWTHLPQLGVKYVFLSVPAPEEVDATLEKLEQHGLSALVMRGSADLSKEGFVEELIPQLDICQRMGVHYLFLSAKRGDAPKETAYARLREAGEAAKARDVIISIETHPDLGANGSAQVETMKRINHPNVRVNFDTGNVTYYNENTTAPDELAKSVEYVATVEFKDHTGGLETWDFPVLGRGKVDFPAIVALLRKQGYAGPVTLEFEGVKGVELNREQTLQAIADSVAYARTLAEFE